MKKMIKPLLCAMTILFFHVPAQAQSISDDLQMLVLDYQKLAGLKKVLSNMYSGYQLVSKGYNSVKDVSQGNFSLQQGFIDGLMLVSPTVRKYPKVARIISDQATIVSEYKAALSAFKSNGHFSASELDYVATVFSNLSDQSVQNLQALTMVITDGSVRMNDDQRLRLIDGIYADTEQQLSFLRSFNGQARTLALRRANGDLQRQQLKQLYDLN